MTIEVAKAPDKSEGVTPEEYAAVRVCFRDVLDDLGVPDDQLPPFTVECLEELNVLDGKPVRGNIHRRSDGSICFDAEIVG